MLFFSPDLLHSIVQAIKPTIQAREQYQRHFDPGMSQAKPANRSDLYSRYRPGFDADLGHDMKLQFVYQYSADYTANADIHPSGSRSDVYKLNFQDNIGPGRLTLGRQDLIIGNQRLLGDPDFNMLGRAFDMARYTGKDFDAFAGRLSVNTNESKYQRIAGGTYETKSFGTTMLVYKHDLNSSLGSIDVFALDQLYKKKFGNLSADFEIVGEEGYTSPDKLRAWAYSGRLTYKAAKSLAVYAECDAASGGKSGNTVMTFDQLYPGNHPYYGIINEVGWRNMNDFMLGSRYTETKQTYTNFEAHDFSLRSASDYLYNNTGSATKYIDPTGKSGSDVGREFDLYQHYDLSKHHAFEVGVALFLPGKFIDALTPKGTNPQSWFYAQYTMKF